MRKCSTPASAPRRAPGAVYAPVSLGLSILLLGSGPLGAQELERLEPDVAPGPAIDLWLESSHDDLEFGYWVSEPAYIALFEIVPGLGATLIQPDRDRGQSDTGRRAAAGEHYGRLYRGTAFRHTLGGRTLSARYGYGIHRPERGYLLLIASRTPLELWRFGRLEDYRYTAAGLGAHTPFDGAARRTAERLVDRVVAHPSAGGWSAAYVSYSLLPQLSRFASGFGSSLCGYGLGAWPFGFGSYAYLPIGAYRYGGYGHGLRSVFFPGFRGFGLASSYPFFWTDPFGIVPGFDYGTGIGYPCGFGFGFGFGRHPFVHFLPPLFPHHPHGRRPSDRGRRSALILPTKIHPQTRMPEIDRLTVEEAAETAVDRLSRGPVPTPVLPAGLERLHPIDAEATEPARSVPPVSVRQIPSNGMHLQRRAPVQERQMPSLERRTPTLERRTPSLQRRAPRLERRTPTLERRTPALERRTPILERGTPSLERRAPRLQRRTTPQRLRSSRLRRSPTPEASRRNASRGELRGTTRLRSLMQLRNRGLERRLPGTFRAPTTRRITPQLPTRTRIRAGQRVWRPSSGVQRSMRPSTLRRPAVRPAPARRPVSKPKKG